MWIQAYKSYSLQTHLYLQISDINFVYIIKPSVSLFAHKNYLKIIDTT